MWQVVAEHSKAGLTGGTLSTITAATKLGGEVSESAIDREVHPLAASNSGRVMGSVVYQVTVLVTGKDVGSVAEQASKTAGVTKVLVADNPVSTL